MYNHFICNYYLYAFINNYIEMEFFLISLNFIFCKKEEEINCKKLTNLIRLFFSHSTVISQFFTTYALKLTNILIIKMTAAHNMKQGMTRIEMTN